MMDWLTLATSGVVAVTATLAGMAPSARSLAISATDTKAIDAIFADYDKPASPGCMLGVVADGAFLYTRGYGRANIEHDVALTQQTVFDIGSTSKQFLATAILLLVEDGKVSLDDDVRKYLPEVPDYGAANHDPAPVDAHQRFARLHHADDAGRLADGGRDLARAGVGHRQPAARTSIFAPAPSLPTATRGFSSPRSSSSASRARGLRRSPPSGSSTSRNARDAVHERPRGRRAAPRDRLRAGGRGLSCRVVQLGAAG